MNEDISLIIKTFARQEALERLLASIREQGYGHCPILIADDSKTPYKDAILQDYGDIVDEYIVLPFNVGVSKGRNELLNHIRTEYFVLHDDDFFYNEETDLLRARKELVEYDLDILCGYLIDKVQGYYFPWVPKRISDALRLYRTHWKKQIWMATFNERSDGGLSIQSVPRNGSVIQTCDLSFQFFIGRTTAIRDIVGGWNPKLKSIGEHWEFFYRCKQAGLRVATSSNFVACHENVSNPTYDSFRHDNEEEMMITSIREHGFRYLKRGHTTFYDPKYYDDH